MLSGVDDEVDVADALLTLAAGDSGPSLAAFLHRHADREQMLEYLRQRSLQQLKESDPQSFLLPRLEGAAKVALAEIQYDELGAGRPERLHQTLFARTLESAGLDPTYGAYLDEVSAVSLASGNVMSLFGLNRRLRGAGAGHFAAFEATSSVPSRKVAAGLDRLGFPPEAAAYFEEHVEADAVHEQVAARACAVRWSPTSPTCGRTSSSEPRACCTSTRSSRASCSTGGTPTTHRGWWRRDLATAARGDRAGLPRRPGARPRCRERGGRGRRVPRGDPPRRRGLRVRQVAADAVVRQHAQVGQALSAS